MTPLDALAGGLVALGSAAPLLALFVGDARLGLGMLLELWTAGALLRLAGDATWTAIGTAALVTLLRAAAAFRRRREAS